MHKITVNQYQPTLSRFSRLLRCLPLGLLIGTIAVSGSVSSSQLETSVRHKSFPATSLKNWKEKSFSGNSKYELVEVDSQRVLKATTESAASVLYKKQEVSLVKTPMISWTWKVDGVYENINERTREGDDFPARLYVVVQTGLFPWQTLAINYVWSSNQEIGQSWDNPYTKKSIMVAVQSGDSQVGEWISQTRNVAQDFKTHFGVDIKKISGYAVMIDGDNAKKSGTAWFADINFGT